MLVSFCKEQKAHSFDLFDAAAISRALRTICHKFLRSGGETSLNCLKFPRIRPSLREYSAGLKTCEISGKRGYSFMLRSRNQTTNQIPRSYKNDGFDWPFYLVIVT